MKKLLLIPFILGILVLIRAQDKVIDQPRFKPFAGITYNLHPLGTPTLASDAEITWYSHFPGIEVGFVLLPRLEHGWQLDYRNTFLGELALYGIADLLKDTYDSPLNWITELTIGNGFLGRLDLGKTVIHVPRKTLLVGFSLSDKVILGTDYLPYTWSGPLSERFTKEGFHLTPGLYAAYRQQLQNQAILSLNLCLSKSVLNLHQFGEGNAWDGYVYPFFSEIDLVYQLPGGLYFRLGTLATIAFQGVNSGARISGGIGYRFRNQFLP